MDPEGAGRHIGDAAESSDELSSCFYAAAAAVSRFNKLCALEAKRQEAQGMRCLCEAVVQHIKLKSEGNTIQASLLVKFLHQQSAVLMSKEKQPKQATESTDLGLLCGTTKSCTYQLSNACLLQETIRPDASRLQLPRWHKCVFKLPTLPLMHQLIGTHMLANKATLSKLALDVQYRTC